MEILEIVQGFLLSAAGVAIIIAAGRYLWNKAGEAVKKTETTLDNKLYSITPKIVSLVLDEYDLGDKKEKILRQIFLEHEKIPADTSKMEQALNEEVKRLEKKSGKQ